jgi:uncharacterized protein YjbI with pentapeptide repeats/beta-lactamase regulating signal transducer with metallopeptidase domain
MMPWQHLLSPSVIQPLGWSLVHFLWQGAVVALLLAGYLRLVRPRSAHARYLTACAALAVMAACPGLTLLGTHAARNWDDGASLRRTGAQNAEWTQTQSSGSAGIGLRGEFAADPTLSQGRQSNLATAVDPLLPGLVVIWLAGVLFLSLRFLGGWIGVQRLGRRATRPIRGPLEDRMAALARRLGIRRPVRLLESARVSVPTVIGWLRAVILLPAGTLTGLTPMQLEALLAHELAHIRRCDYLVNLLQTAVETLLFYHPAVWWVSGTIRAEREHCCDDLAVDALGDRITYARALTALEALRSGPRSLALAGNGGDLMARIRRIVGPRCGRAEPIGAWLAVTAVLPLLLAAGASSRVTAASRDARLVRPGTTAATVARFPLRPVAGSARSRADRIGAHATNTFAAGSYAAAPKLPDLRPQLPDLRRAASPAGVGTSVPGLAGTRLAVPGPDRADPSATEGFRTQLVPANMTAPEIGRVRRAVMDLSGIRAPEPPRARIVLASLDTPDEDRSPLDRPGVDLTRVDLARMHLAGANLSCANLSGVNLSGQNLSRTNFSSANLSHVRFGDANLSHANLSSANLTDADLSHARLSGANLSGARLDGARLSGADLSGVNLSGADLSRVEIKGVDLSGAELSGINLAEKDLSGMDLSGVNLSGANLRGARLGGANLTDTNLSGANLTRADLSRARVRGANLSGAILDQTNLRGLDLSDVNLSSANLTRQEFKDLRLSGANLSGINLAGKDLSGLDLSDANLSGANLRRARLVGANLTDANLSGADLTDADLSQARLSGANLSGTRLHGAHLKGVDLSDVNR